MNVTRDHLATRIRPGQIVGNLVRVCGVAKRTKHWGRAHLLSVILADGTRSLDAIAGTDACSLVIGEAMHVWGCVVVRRGRPILVVSRPRPQPQGTLR